MGRLIPGFAGPVKAGTTPAPQLRCIDRLGRRSHNRARESSARIGAAGPGQARNFPMLDGKSGRRTTRLVALALCAAAVLGLSVADALAQGWGWWPWSQPEPRRIEREPIYRPPMPGEMPPGQLPPGQMQPPPPGTGAGLRPAHEQHLPAAGAAAGGRDAGQQSRARAAAQDRERHAHDRAQLSHRAVAAQPRRLLGPVPVLAHAAAHAALRPARQRGG